MHKLRLPLIIFAAFAPATTLAQSAGGAPSGSAYPDVRNSDDFGAHDASSNPSNRDLLINSIRERSLDRALEAKRKKLGVARPATAAELTPGAPVNDNTGVAIAKIEQVDPDGVVVSTGAAKVKVPAESFGHNKSGLLLDLTKAQFEQVVAQANAAS